MHVKIDTDKLNLPGIRGGFVEPLPAHPLRRGDRLAAVRALRDAGLSALQVRRLLRDLTIWHNVRMDDDAEPSLGEDREVLRAVVDLARCLATVLDGASARAEATLLTAALKGFRDQRFHNQLMLQLQTFASAVQAQIDSLPVQARRQSRLDIVGALVAVAGTSLPQPTTDTGSRFYVACQAAFTLSGLTTSPDRAIRAFQTRERLTIAP